MKLAEGLVLRADRKKCIEQLRERLRLSAIVQEGEQPPEDPAELFVELRRLLEQFQSLVERINRTNLAARLPSGATLTAALAERDTLTLYHQALSATVDAATPKLDRLARMEIKKVPTVSIGDLRRELDETARRRRELDMLIQSINWTVDLLE